MAGNDPNSNTPRLGPDEFKLQMDKRIGSYHDRLDENIARVGGLIRFYDSYGSLQMGGDDILRAAVVLMHAYLEDFLRTIAAELLPVGDENCLREIPLAGSGGFGRGEKFTLGQLVPHKGKSVDELLHESVSDYLSRSNYNSTAEIAALISRLGFDVEEHNKNFDVIDKMIKRRHQIVHRADRVNESGKPVLQPINRSEVLDWLQATHGFTSGLVSPLITKIAVLLVPDLMQSRQHAGGAATPLLAPPGRST